MRGEFSTLRTELFELAVVPALTPHPVQMTASLRAIATLAIFRPRRIARWKNRLRHIIAFQWPQIIQPTRIFWFRRFGRRI